jgi:cyclophilin family peptidyl-prolyl cis-trans isomerase/HEAT repeat protein
MRELRALALLPLLLACAAAPRAAGSPTPDAAAPVWARLLKMEDERRLDSVLVGEALASAEPRLRAAGALSVGRVGGRKMAPTLRALLADPDTAVAASAAFALGLLRDTASVPALAAALAASVGVASEAAWSLGQIGEPARDAIERALASSREPRIASALLVAGGRLRPVPVERIAPHLASREAEIVRAAAYAIGRARPPAGMRPVLAIATSPDLRTREYVARALARSAAGDSLADSAVALLGRLAADPHPHVRIAALRSLGGYGPRAREALLRAARDADANVRIAAAAGLTTALGADRAAWAMLWDVDTSLAYRASLAGAAVAAGVTPDALDPGASGSWPRAADWRLRMAAAQAAGEAPDADRVRELVAPLLADADGRVRAAAYGALAAHANRPGADGRPWLRETLLRALDDPDAVARATALGALAERAAARELPAALAAMRRSAADTLNEARVAAASYIAAAWRRDSAAVGDSLRAALAALSAPDDPLVRAAGRGATPLATWARAPLPTRPLSWYEARVRELVLPALAGRLPRAVIATARGDIELELLALDAPLTVHNFLELARAGFYDGGTFHRVVPGFVAQDGDPRGDGSGGPGWAIRDELDRHRYERGAVGMALAGPDTGGSQWFITLAPQPHLDGGYTVFARVVAGMAAADALVQGDAIRRIAPR